MKSDFEVVDAVVAPVVEARFNFICNCDNKTTQETYRAYEAEVKAILWAHGWNFDEYDLELNRRAGWAN